MTRDTYIKAAVIVRRIDELSVVLGAIRNRDATKICAGSHTVFLPAPCALSDESYVACHKTICKALEDYRAALQHELEAL